MGRLWEVRGMILQKAIRDAFTNHPSHFPWAFPWLRSCSPNWSFHNFYQEIGFHLIHCLLLNYEVHSPKLTQARRAVSLAVAVKQRVNPRRRPQAKAHSKWYVCVDIVTSLEKTESVAVGPDWKLLVRRLGWTRPYLSGKTYIQYVRRHVASLYLYVRAVSYGTRDDHATLRKHTCHWGSQQQITRWHA